MKLTLATPVDTTPAIAIIGAACRLPQAPDLHAFADLLDRGQDAVGEIPPTRWARALFHHPDPAQPGKSYTFAAGCLDQIDQFDPAFFGISPREAAQMDPQQRLLLELTVEALEDAGIRPGALAGSRSSVHIGASSSDYVTLRLGDPAGADPYFMTGSALCALSNRISHAFDLRGPSFTVDSACSSSLVALHLACETLRNEAAGIAIAGGVNLLLAPQSFVGFARAGMLSPTGRCHAFDAAADGYVRAEGGGVLVLKPLLAALADNDCIHAVIRATAVNSDGHTTGFSLPSPTAQADLLRAVYDASGLRADDLVYLEAHGTGTPVGDPIEAAALGAVLGSRRARPLPIGSVKTNIGHLEAASGIAGLLKLIVAFGRGAVPPSLHRHTPNPAIPFAALNLSLPAGPVRIPAGAAPMMGINAFGFGGTNAHAVLQAPPPPDRPEPAPPPPMLLLSARSEPALQALAQSWRGLLQRVEPAALGPLLRGAARGRELYPHRLAVLGAHPQDLAAALERHTAGRATAAVITGTALRQTESPDPARPDPASPDSANPESANPESGGAGSLGLAFAFAGNGSQWAGMAQDALAASRAFAAGLDEVDAELAPLLGWSVRAALSQPDADRLRRIEVAQPLLFAVQAASVMALQAAGVVASAHLGHSAGEVAAAWASGALSLPDAAALIAVRSRHQQTRHGVGRMAVLGLAPRQATAALADLHGLSIAAVNSAAMVTIAGPETALAALAARAAASGWSWLPLDLDYAFHSPAMDPIRAGLMADLAGLTPRATHTAFISTVTGRPAEGAALDEQYWWRNVRAPVRFAQAAGHLAARGTRLFLEIGPQAVLQGFLRDALARAGAAGRVLPVLSRRPASVDPFLLAAARCHVAGHDISAGPLFDGPAQHRGLPHYPWQRQRCWFDRTGEATDQLVTPPTHALLGFPRAGAAGAWFSHLDLATQPWLADHVIDGAVLLPAAAMIDLALAACASAHPGAAVAELRDLQIARPLALQPGQMLELAFSHDPQGNFSLASRARLSAEPFLCHATGRLSACAEATALHPAPPPAPAARSLPAEEFYRAAAGLGLAYGPAFRTVRGISLDGPGVSVVALAQPAPPYPALIDPTLLDGALQGLAAMAGDGPAAPAAAGFVPVRFGRVRLFARATPPVQAHLRITAAGPRSLCADLLLTAADGSPVIELLECWCAAWPRAGQPACGQALTSLLAPTLPAELPPLPPPSAPAPAVEPLGATEPHLLADACLASAAHAALAPLIATAPAAGPASAASPKLFQMLLEWLEQDGLASSRNGVITLAAETGLPPAGRLFGSLLFDQPASSAEAALLAAFADPLPARLRGEAAPLPAPLLDQLRHESPSAAAMTEALAAEFGRLVAAWPAARRLRVLDLTGGSLVLARRLLPLLAGRPDASYIALSAEPGAAPLPATLAAAHPGLRMARGGSPEEAALRDIDIAVGLHALTSQAGAAPLLAGCLAHNAVLLLAEPAPNRLWQALATAGLPCRGGLRPGEHWIQVLEDAGFGACQLTPIATPFWPASLIAARCLCPAAAPAAAAGATSASLPPPLLCALDQPGCRPFGPALTEAPACREADLPARIASMQAGGLVLLLPTPEDTSCTAAIAGLLAKLAALAAPLAAAALSTDPLSADPVSANWAAPVLLVLRAAAEADPCAAALQGFRRVLVNETGGARCRLLRIDPGFTASEADSIIRRERAHDDGEDEIAWTRAGRLVPRLRGLPPPVQPGVPVRLAAARPGALGSLVWQAQPERAPGPGEVLVEVAAAGLNFRDVMWALGLLPEEALLRGFAGPTLGLECAGTVRAAGPGVTGLTPGMRVMGLAPAALSSQVVTAAHALIPVPDAITDAQAATIPVASLTVAYALGHMARLGAGERVLIHGAAGGVGLMAVQYARARGAEIFVTAGTPAKRAALRLLGVEHVLDSRGLGFADEIRRRTGGQGVDVVLNCLSGPAMEHSLALLRPFGRFLELGKRDLYGNTGIGLRPLRHNVTYFAIDADQLPAAQPALAARLLAEIGALIETGALRPLPYRGFDFARAEDAFRLMQSAGHIGKIVLTPGRVPPAPAAAPHFAARADATYLLTGALSGFGRSLALWLLDHGARHLAVLSRTGPADPAAATLQAECAARGAQLHVHACDVADEAALAACLRQIRAAAPPIAGVAHCAMVLHDALLPHQDEAGIEATLRPKLAGAVALDRLTRADPVELFLLFSSIVTSLGNPGQAGYVAANAALEAIAERRHAEHLPALAIGWGPIADAGVLARDRAVSAELARRLGAAHMSAGRALAALPALLASRRPVVSFADIPWGAARAHLPVLAGRFAEGLSLEAPPAQVEPDFRASLAALPPDQASAQVAALLVEQIADILRLAADRIDPNTPLADLGMDSLMAVELRIALERRFGIALPLLSLSSGLTPAAMAARLARTLADPAPLALADLVARHEPTPPDPTPPQAALPEPVAAAGA